jgi:hypothetical protein
MTIRLESVLTIIRQRQLGASERRGDPRPDRASSANERALRSAEHVLT